MTRLRRWFIPLSPVNVVLLLQNPFSLLILIKICQVTSYLHSTVTDRTRITNTAL